MTHYLVGEDPARAAALAAQKIAALSRDAVEARGVFVVALAWSDELGRVYDALRARKDVDWKRWEVFFAEERAVSTEDPRSVYQRVNEVLLSRVPVRDTKVRPMFSLGLDVATAASDYATEVAGLLGDAPVFDLVTLTLGRNADVLGLHPLSPALQETAPVAGVEDPPLDPPVDRVTLTPPVLRAARALMLVLFGGHHARALRMTFDDADDRARVPAQVIRDAEGEVTVCLDALLAKGAGVQ